MSEKPPTDASRRTLLLATSAAGGVATLGAMVPLVASLTPSERTKATSAPVEVDLSTIQPGEMLTVEWQGKPVWILRRTEAMLASLAQVAGELSDPGSARPQQPPYAQNETRSIHPEFLVVVGLCTHLGCSPTPRFEKEDVSGIRQNWAGGFLCPCHGALFDLAGRVFKNQPAPTNLFIPPHQYLSATRLLIGEHSGA